MNGKTARAARQLARIETVGLREVLYDEYAPPTFHDMNMGKPGILPNWVKTSKGVPLRMVRCTRLAAKQHKRLLRAIN